MRVAATVLAAVLLVGCGPGPKPATLLTFERLRKEAEGTAAKSADDKLWKDSDNYYRLAYEAWEDGDDEEAREYTLLGTMLFHTCRELARQREVESEITSFQERYDETKLRRARWVKEKGRTEQAVTALQGQLALANRLAEVEKRRAVERAALQGRVQEEQELAQVRQRHSDLIMRLKESEKILAHKFAAGEYNKARNLLDKAALDIEDGKTREARRTLEKLASQLAAAVEKAQPKFTAASKARDREETNQRLVAMAHTVGASEVRVEPRGVVLVLHKLFDGKATRLTPKASLRLDKAGKLINEFAEYNILIEGHTAKRKGKEDANLTISRAWSLAVMSHYVSKGISTTRLHATGYGAGAPLSDNSTKPGRRRNRRIELVFLFPRD